MRYVAAILLALVAVALTVTVGYVSLQDAHEPVQDAPDPAGAAPRMPAADDDALRREVERHAEAIRRLQAAVALLAARVDDQASAAPEARGTDAETVETVHGEVAELRARLEEVEALIEERSALALPGAPVPRTPEERQLAAQENQRSALERAQPVGERLVALRELRELDARSFEVTQAMLELVEDPTLPSRTRADIIRNLDGVAFEELKTSLLGLLEHDTHPETRSETIETLQVFYDDPVVYDAVRRVRDGEGEDPQVRAEAAQRLEQYDQHVEASALPR